MAEGVRSANSNMALFNLSKLFGRSELSTLESHVLTAVSAELPPAARDIFNKQRDSINLIQRHADGKEVNLYAMQRGKPYFDEQSLFPLRTIETQLATVEMVAGGGQKSLRAEVWLVKGWVFSICFNRPPKGFLQSSESVINTKILCDPMKQASEQIVSNGPGGEEALKTIRSTLPDEYLRLVRGNEGILINGWSVCEVQDIRKVLQRDGNYYLLAEKKDMGGVAVKEDESSGQLYYLDYGDDRAEKITVNLRTFFEEFDVGKS